MGKSVDPDRLDPEWPKEEHPLSELCAPIQASFSPFGELEFPLDTVPYEHPVTEINR